MTDDQTAYHAARAVLGGKPFKTTTNALFARLESNPRYSRRELREARRVFDAMEIGEAAEALLKADPTINRMAVALRLARVARRHLVDRRRGWFGFLLRLGAGRGDSMFQLSFARRPQSGAAQPKVNLDRTTRIGRTVNNSIVAGAILKRIENVRAKGQDLLVKSAIEAAINENEIKTEEEAARASWQEFRKYCRALTPEPGTYRLMIYDGSIERYKGRWVALPDVGPGCQPLPSSKGGAPKKTS